MEDMEDDQWNQLIEGLREGDQGACSNSGASSVRGLKTLLRDNFPSDSSVESAPMTSFNRLVGLFFEESPQGNSIFPMRIRCGD